MKRFYMIIAVMLISVTAFGQTAKSIYNKYNNEKDVSTVYISPTMFKMIGQLPDLEIGDDGVDITPIIKSLKGMYVVDSKNPQVNGSLRGEINALLTKKEFELLLELSDEGQRMKMFTKVQGELISSFIMVVEESNEITFIMFEGKIAMKDFNRLISSQL